MYCLFKMNINYSSVIYLLFYLIQAYQNISFHYYEY